jgi:diguanylate cyclase (GGDEF)-like protein/PAS domain S-box-containing protein
MEQVEDQVYLTAQEVTHLLDQATQSLTDDLLVDAIKEERLSDECKRLETALHISEKRFEMVVTNVPIVLNTFDRAGIITLSIGGGLVPLGRAPGESVGHSVYELYSAYPEMLGNIRRALAGETFSAVSRAQGRVFNTRFMPIFDQYNEVNSLVSIAVDITERKKAEESLLNNGQIYQALSEQATDLVLITSLDGTVKYLSPSHQRILGYDPESMLNKNVFSFIHPEDRKQVKAAFSLAYRDPAIVAKTAFRFPHVDGTWLMLECTGRNCLHDPAVKGFIVNARDITNQIKLEETLRHQALHDALTDLPNRAFLQTRLNQALINAERQQNGVALLVMDLDRFKEINDTFGYHYGDLLLQQVSTRLVQAIGGAGIVSRLGGDEFAILLPKADEESTGIIAEQLRNVLEEPFMITGYPLNVEASVGIVLYPLHGTDDLTLIRRADVAMYAAKSTHEGIAFYKTTHDDQYSSRRLAMIGALRQAIAANELTLYYQPKVNLKTGLTSSVEALARWQHPIHGFVPPDQFITLAEQTGLINALTAWALETAVRQCSVWLQAGLSLSIAVNLSSWNLRDVTLPETIMSLLTRYSVPSQLLRVELTESAIMTDTDRALDVLHRLAALGIHISVDDFGTGYSSLAYLKRLPIDELKIDRSFVQHMLDVEADATIVRSTIMLAHNLGLHIVAEGIEDKATLNLLADFDCDIAQGYYMSCPIPAAELERWLRTFPQLVKR